MWFYLKVLVKSRGDNAIVLKMPVEKADSDKRISLL